MSINKYDIIRSRLKNLVIFLLITGITLLVYKQELYPYIGRFYDSISTLKDLPISVGVLLLLGIITTLSALSLLLYLNRKIK